MPRWLKLVAIVVGALLVLAASADWFLHSRFGSDKVAALAQDQIERNVGLHATFGSFRLTWRPLGAEIANIHVEGRESATQPAVADIAHVRVRARIASWLPLTVQLTDVTVTQPRVRLYQLLGGKWDVPPPPILVQPPLEPIFDLGLRHLRLEGGEVDLQDRKLAVSADLANVTLRLQLDPARHYDGLFGFQRGHIATGIAASAVHPRPLPGEQRATVRFTVWPNDIRLDQLDWHAGASRLQASGMIQDLAHPRVALGYQLHLPLEEWRGVLPRWPVPKGQVTVAGRAHWTVGGGWSAEGQFTAADLRLERRWAATGTLQAAGQYRADAAGLTLPRVALRGMGGTGHAQLTLDHWRRVRASGRIEGLQLQRLAQIVGAVRGQRVPASPFAGTLSAQFDARGQLDQPAAWNIAASARITPPAAGDGGATAANGLPLPLAGALRVTAQGPRWEVRIAQLRSDTPHLGLLVNGIASSRGNDLHFRIASDDLARWQPYLAPYLPTPPGGAPGQAPALAGRVHLTVDLSGTLSRPALAVQLQLASLRYGPAIADLLTAQASVAPAGAALTSLSWQRGGETFTASGHIGLSDFRVTPASSLQFKVQGNNLDLEQLIAWSGRKWPVAGRLSLAMAIHGTLAQPEATGDVTLAHASLVGQPVASLRAHLIASRQSVAASDVSAVLAGATITGQGGYDFRAGAVQLQAAGRRLDLSQVAALQSPRVSIAGRMDFSAHAAGPLSHPHGALQIAAADLRGGNESLGLLNATIQADGTTARLQGALGLPTGRLLLSGSAAQASPYAVNATARLEDYDIDTLLRRFTHARVTGHSHISGEITVQGPLARPRQLVAQANFDPLELSVEGLTLENAGPVRIGLANDRVGVAQARLVGTDTDVSVVGTARLGSPGELSGSAQGHVDLALLHALRPTIHSSGQIQLAARLGGTLRQPTVNGEVRVRDVSLAEEDVPVAFDHMEGTLRFTGERVDIVRLSAQTGSGGEIALAGFAARTPTGATADVSATANGLRIRYQGISATGDLRLRLNGNLNNLLLSGQVELTRVSVARDFDFALFLAGRRTSIPVSAEQGPLAAVHLDVRIVTGPEIEVATSAARLQIQADLRARGTLANPILLGRVSIAQGEVRFAGNEYTIGKGEVTFANPFRIDPILDFSLGTTVQQYDVTLNVTGPVDKLNITYRSDPPLSSGDIVALLATGQTQTAQAAINQQSTGSFVGQSEQLLGLAFDNLVNSRLERMFGVTQIQINPNAYAGGYAGTTGQATVTIVQRVSRNLKVTYTQNLATSSQDIILVEWTINRHVGLVLSRDQFGLYGISLHFSHRAR